MINEALSLSTSRNDLVPAAYAEKAMASILQLHQELMDEKERRVELFRTLMEREQALAELRMYVKLLEERPMPAAPPRRPPESGPLGDPGAPARARAQPAPSPLAQPLSARPAPHQVAPSASQRPAVHAVPAAPPRTPAHAVPAAFSSTQIPLRVVGHAGARPVAPVLPFAAVRPDWKVW